VSHHVTAPAALTALTALTASTESGFRRSSFCGSVGCVEVAALPGDEIAVRDAKDERPDAPMLRFTATEWDAFVSGVLAGEFSRAALARA
jgi:Domain of unknown function (DUF397)